MRRWEVIAEMIKKNGYQRIAEIGVCKGATALPILKECDLIRYYAIDPAFDKVFLKAIEGEPYPALRVYHNTSEEAAELIDDVLDLVFIDAIHDEAHVDQDIHLWTPKVRPGGTLCGHDYENKRFPGVKIAVQRYYGAENVEVYPVRACMLWIYHVPKE